VKQPGLSRGRSSRRCLIASLLIATALPLSAQPTERPSPTCDVGCVPLQLAEALIDEVEREGLEAIDRAVAAATFTLEVDLAGVTAERDTFADAAEEATARAEGYRVQRNWALGGAGVLAIVALIALIL
jgi:hypothetical protein